MTYRALLPHVEEIINFELMEQDAQLQRATVLQNSAWYISAQGNYNLAIQRREQSLNIRSLSCTKKIDECWLAWRTWRRRTGIRDGWKEAEELDVQVMETSLRVLGAEHPDTLTSMANLASTYRNQGRWKEAEELEVQVMETRKRVLGAEHPDTLTSMNNLAHTYKLEGRSDQAIELMKHVVELSAKTIGPNHPLSVASTNSLIAWSCME